MLAKSKAPRLSCKLRYNLDNTPGVRPSRLLLFTPGVRPSGLLLFTPGVRPSVPLLPTPGCVVQAEGSRLQARHRGNSLSVHRDPLRNPSTDGLMKPRLRVRNTP